MKYSGVQTSGLELWRKTAALDNFFNQAFYEVDHLRKEMDNWVLLFGVLVNQVLYGEMKVLNQMEWEKHTVLL